MNTIDITLALSGGLANANINVLSQVVPTKQY